MTAPTATLFIVGIIEVNQPQHMTKLVTDGTDALNTIYACFPAVYFGWARVSCETHSIIIQIIIRQITGMRPNIIRIITRERRSKASEDEIYHVDVAIVV